MSKKIVVVRASGMTHYGSSLVLDGGLYVLHGVRQFTKAWNVERTKSLGYAAPHDDMMFGGTFQATHVEPPEWWDRTQIDAEKSIGGGS